jgi:transcriptional regulator with XRE-family HTH domain
MELAERLLELRKQKGWSQWRLAQEAGIPQPSVSRLESGNIEDPLLSTIEKIAKAFGVSIDYLVSEEYRVKPRVAIAIKPRVVIEDGQ